MKNLISRLITGVIFSIVFWSTFLLLPQQLFSYAILAVLGLIILFEWPRFFPTDEPTYWLLMPLYPVLPFVLIVLLNQTLAGHQLLTILFTMGFMHDTGSYIIGVLFGKHKLSPLISPFKTWEGTLGGYVCGLVGCIASLLEIGVPLFWPFIFWFTMLVCTVLLCGDLFESFLKRRVDIKDSGFLLPGHGGLLDRFDGIMFGAVLFYVMQHYLIGVLGLG